MNFFGSTRTTSPIGQVASAEFAQIVIGQRVTLAQSCQWQFARPLRPIAAIGDPHVYFSPGIGQGSVALGRIVGPEGLGNLLASNSAGECGIITALQITAGAGRCLVVPTKTLNFGGAMYESVAGALASQNPEIVENYNIRVTQMDLV
jgi:hypothetical protein